MELQRTRNFRSPSAPLFVSPCEATMGWPASAPPVLASSGASRRPATIKPHCVASPTRVRSGGRGRTAIFSRTSAHSPSLSACHISRESHGWSAVRALALWPHVTSLRSKCAQREISRKFSRSLTQVLISVTDPGCSRRRPFVGRTAQLSAAYRPQPHSPTACARAPSLVDRTAALLPQWRWLSKSKAARRAGA